MKKSYVLLCITVLLSSLSVYAAKRPSVLFVGSTARHMHTWNDWLDSGFELGVAKTDKIKSLKDIAKFNTVVVNFLPHWNSNGTPKPELVRFRKILDQYMKQGGGVIVFGGGGQWSGMAPSVSYLLKPYGAAVPEEQVTDSKSFYKEKLGRHYRPYRICYTRKISPGPMTKGIKIIGFMGDASRNDCMKTTQPVVILDKNTWNIVVRGEKTAYSAEALKPGTSRELKKTPATYASEPVLAAWRNVSKGRLFVLPMNVAFTVATPDVFGNILWQKELRKDKPLQNRQLIMQAIRWAAQPSLDSGKFGGFKTDRNIPFDYKAILNPRPIAKTNWSNINVAGEFGDLKGLVGAQSKYSGGRYSVAQLSKAAQAAGLSFLAFTEDLEKLNPSKWERFKKECRMNSNSKFLAIPGILAKDKVGNLWFSLGGVKFPHPSGITKDGKRIDNTYQFWTKQFNNRLGGFVNPLSNPNKWYEMKHTSGMSVISKTKDMPVEKAFKEFLLSNSKAENLIPFRFSEVSTPAEIKEAAKGVKNIFTGKSIADLKNYVKGTKNFRRSLCWANPHHWYLSDGPQLVFHGGHNLGNLNTDEEKQNLFRYVLKLDNLKAGDKIFLYDGPNKYREWMASGKKFEVTRTWPLQQRRDLSVQVERNNQVVFVSSSIGLHFGSRFMQCGDRQNTLPYNFVPDRKGHYYVSGIPLGAHYRAWPPNTLVYGNYKVWLTGADGIEYQPPMYMSFTTSPYLPLAGDDMVPANRLASYQYPKLSCPGIIIVDEICSRMYTKKARNYGDCLPPKKTEPLKTFNLYQRRYGLYGMLDQSNAQFIESKLTMLKDCTSKGNLQVSVMSYPAGPDSPKKAEISVGGKISKYAFNNLPTFYRDNKLTAGDYYGLYPYGLAGGGAQYAISNNLKLKINHKKNKKSLSCAFYTPVPRTLKKDTEIKYAMLFSTGGLKPGEERSAFQRIDDFLGVRDNKFPAISNISGGTLEAEPVIATIATSPEKVLTIETKKSPDAPLALPLRVRGFNPNWITVYSLNDSKTWRYCGELENDLYFKLYTSMSAHKVVMGHPVTADNKDVVINLNCPDGNQGQFEVYNPTNQKMTVNLKTNTTFLPSKSITINLNPLESKQFIVKKPLPRRKASPAPKNLDKWRHNKIFKKNGKVDYKDNTYNLITKAGESIHLYRIKAIPALEGNTMKVKLSIKGKGKIAPGVYYYNNPGSNMLYSGGYTASGKNIANADYKDVEFSFVLGEKGLNKKPLGAVRLVLVVRNTPGDLKVKSVEYEVVKTKK